MSHPAVSQFLAKGRHAHLIDAVVAPVVVALPLRPEHAVTHAVGVRGVDEQHGTGPRDLAQPADHSKRLTKVLEHRPHDNGAERRTSTYRLR